MSHTSSRNFYNQSLTKAGSLIDPTTSRHHPISAVQLNATISLPNGKVAEIGTLSMLSISQHRETFPVTAQSHIGPKGYTRGHRMIAGTMVFHIFQQSAFQQVLDYYQAPQILLGGQEQQRRDKTTAGAFYDMPYDELPPFDLHVVYITPEGLVSYEGLRGVYLVDEGSIRSIDIPNVQESYSYFATKRIPLQALQLGQMTPANFA